MKKIKLFPIALAGLCSGVGFSYYLDKHPNSFEKVSNVSVYDDFVGPAVTSVTFATTSTTYTTTENIYKDIMFLYNDNYSMSQINDMIIKYSSYCNISYNDAVSILKKNIDSFNQYNSLENYVMSGLFDGASDLGLLSSFCTDGIIKKEMSRDEMEAKMIDMCNVMGMSNDDIKIVLSIFRWETGHGTSSLCVNCNNYGGIKVGNDFGIYQTPEFGMYKAIRCINWHIKTSRDKGFNDVNSIVSDMSFRYCYDTANEWANCINEMINSVNEYYHFDNQHVKKYEG